MIADVAPVDVDATVARVQVDGRNSAVPVARTAADRPVLDVEMLAGFAEVGEPVEQTLGKRLALLLLERLGRLVPVSLLRLFDIAHPDRVVAAVGRTNRSDVGVEVVAVLPRAEVLTHRGVDGARLEPPQYHDEPVKALLALGNLDLADGEHHPELLQIELLPTSQLRLGGHALHVFGRLPATKHREHLTATGTEGLEVLLRPAIADKVTQESDKELPQLQNELHWSPFLAPVVLLPNSVTAKFKGCSTELP